jgi:hypothetical protein
MKYGKTKTSKQPRHRGRRGAGGKKGESKWRRCGNARCGRLVLVPGDPRGHGCPGCGEPLSRARNE